MRRLNSRIFLKGVAFMYPFVFALLWSCENGEAIGVEVQPDSNQRLEIIDTISIVAKNVIPEHIQTNNRINELLGVVNDASFGESRAHLTSNFMLSIAGADFGDGVLLDSAVLMLVVSDEYQNETASLIEQTLQVYELNEDLSGDSAYYSDSEPSYNSTPIGNYTGEIDASEIIVDDVLEASVLNIRLDDTWASDFLNAVDGRFTDTETLKSIFKGVHVRCETPAPNAGNGEIYSINLRNGFSGIRFYYSNDTDDSLFYDLEVSESEIRYSNFEHDRAGTPLEAAVDNLNSAENEMYIQAMAGAAVELQFPHLQALADQGVLLINKAEIILTLTEERDWPEVALMNMAAYNDERTLVSVQDFFDSSVWDETRDLSSKQYRMPFTLQLQNILADYTSGENSNFGLLLIPDGNSIYPERVMLQGTKTNLNQCKLIVTYTPLN